MSPRIHCLRTLALAACVLAPGWTGCERADSDRSTRQETAPPPPGFPRTVALPDGTELKLRRPPARVVLANTTTVDLAIDLLEPNQVAALCEQAFDWSGLALRTDGFRERPTFPRFVAEAILQHSPDLVLCSTHNQPDTIGILRKAGVPIVCFGHPKTLDEVRAMVRLTARVLGQDDRFAAFERDLDRRVAKLRARAAKQPRMSALFYNYFGTQGRTNGADTLANVAIELAGMTNAAAGLEGAVPLSFEQLLTMDPDVLIVSQTLQDLGTPTESIVRRQAALEDLRALGEGCIVSLHPAHYSCASQLIVSAAERIAEQVDQQLAEGTLRPRSSPGGR